MTIPKHDQPVNAEFEATAVEVWIEAGWLRPQGGEGLSEIDLARAQLIHDLTVHLGINDEGVPVILDLIDQLHGLRLALRTALAQPRRAGS